MPDTSPAALFEAQHRRIDAHMQAHLLHLIAGDFAAAYERLQRWQRAIERHIHIENTRLLPHLPEGARWAARVYLLEHERIVLLAQEYAERLQAMAARPPRSLRARHGATLELLDAVHALRHVLEHHHEREHMALAVELPQTLQHTVWGQGRRLRGNLDPAAASKAPYPL